MLESKLAVHFNKKKKENKISLRKNFLFQKKKNKVAAVAADGDFSILGENFADLFFSLNGRGRGVGIALGWKGNGETSRERIRRLALGWRYLLTLRRVRREERWRGEKGGWMAAISIPFGFRTERLSRYRTIERSVNRSLSRPHLDSTVPVLGIPGSHLGYPNPHMCQYVGTVWNTWLLIHWPMRAPHVKEKSRDIGFILYICTLFLKIFKNYSTGLKKKRKKIKITEE